MARRKRISVKCMCFSCFMVLRLTCYRVDTCTGLLPEAKPRYVMGVVSYLIIFRTSKYNALTRAIQGYPEDLMASVALGADMFDCVWPTRTGVSLEI